MSDQAPILHSMTGIPISQSLSAGHAVIASFFSELRTFNAERNFTSLFIPALSPKWQYTGQHLTL
jgi:hypothetical protein